MATERQIEANRRNAVLSKGPSSEAGKARSRASSTKHGLAGESAELEASLSPEFEERRARWAAEQNPVGEAANFALDRLVAATFRIERCERAMDEVVSSCQQRARLVWDEDRAIEAATIAGRLDRDPVLGSRQLQATLAGVVLLIEAWLGLVAALQAGNDWSESEASRALDLLGVAADLRSGRTLIDGVEGIEPVAFRRDLAFEEIQRLETLRDEALIPLDEMERRQAMAGNVALHSKQAKLVLRYERDAWKRFRESMKEVKASAEVVVAPPPPPVVAPPPRAVAQPARATQAEAPPARPEVSNGRLASMGLDDKSKRLDALDRRIDCQSALPGSYVPIAAGARATGG